MNNVEDVIEKMQKEIDVLQQRIEHLEHSIPYFGKAISYTTRSGVSGYIVWKDGK